MTLVAAVLLLALTQLARAVEATGGNATNDIGGYRIHTFTSNGTLSVSGGGAVEVLVVGGGGGGGSGGPGKDTDSGGGGGGAGGLIYSNAFPVNAGSITVTVGAGGAGGSTAAAAAANGGNSVFGSLIAIGGGRGACAQTAHAAAIGGSGGGASHSQIARGNGTPGQGNQGGSSVNAARYAGGSGGGAGASGLDSTVQYGNGLNGGAGVSQSISGAFVDYAGGGGSGAGGWWVTIGGGGGTGGGGAGGGGGVAGSAGTDSTGGGGGGGGCASVNGVRTAGGPGGSGIVIVRYLWGGPQVSNAGAAITASYVTLKGFLVSTGWDGNVSAAVFWGTNDAGQACSGWAYTNYFQGTAAIGPLSTNVVPIAPGAKHYYRFYATNSLGDNWADPAGRFTWMGAPSVNNAGGAINVGAGAATLQGEVTAGGPAPSVRIYWGRIDQGANKTLWEHEISLGVIVNWDFSAFVDGLSSRATYYYRCYASNSYGDAWSPVATAFTPGLGTVHYVNKANTTPNAPYSSWAWAATNIQDAIDAAATNEIVFVTNGVYDTGGRTAGSALTNRVVITKGIKVIAVSTNPSDTVIVGAADTRGGAASNGPAAVRCVYIQNSCTLSGFTLTNGYTSDVGDQSGGGVTAGSSAQITNCVITGCRAYHRGGGGIQGTYMNCTIRGNTQQGTGSGAGGGLSDATAINSLITGNRQVGGWGGGGIVAGSATKCTISSNASSGGYGGGGAYGGSSLVECQIVGNSGGGMCSGTAERCKFINNSGSAMFGGTARNCLMVGNSTGESGGGARGGTLVNCTIVFNSAASWIIGGGGISMGASAVNCIIYYNSAPNVNSNCSSAYSHSSYATYPAYSCTCPTNRLDYDPAITGLVERAPGLADINAGDYRLSSARSPCFNTGTNQNWMTNAVDLDGQPRIRHGNVDMGAYELWIKSGTIFRGK